MKFLSLQTAGVFWAVVAAIFDFMTQRKLGRVKIATLRVGAMAKEGKGGEREGGKKKICLPI